MTGLRPRSSPFSGASSLPSGHAGPKSTDVSGRASGIEKALLRAVAFLLFLMGWWGFTLLRPSLLLPSPGETLFALLSLLPSPELWQALWISNQAMLLGFLVSALTGIPLGLAVGRYRLVRKVAAPYLTLILAMPLSALLPIFVMALGIGLTARVAVVYLFAIAVIVMTTSAGVQSIDRDLLAMARSFGASELDLWRKVLLPGSLPGIAASLRLGLARSLSGMVIVELLLVSVGLGRLILRYQGLFDAGRLFAVVFIILLEAVLLNRLMDGLHRRARTNSPYA
jgi:ABC-type nitrate/sulfonate/bicarbonate transport system permease component